MKYISIALKRIGESIYRIYKSLMPGGKKDVRRKKTLRQKSDQTSLYIYDTSTCFPTSPAHPIVGICVPSVSEVGQDPTKRLGKNVPQHVSEKVRRIMRTMRGLEKSIMSRRCILPAQTPRTKWNVLKMQLNPTLGDGRIPLIFLKAQGFIPCAFLAIELRTLPPARGFLNEPPEGRGPTLRQPKGRAAR